MKKLFIITILLVAGMAVTAVSVSGDSTTSVVSCLGDSITEGIPYSGTENTYPARLQVMLDAAYGSGSFEVINHGVGGWRADQVRDHVQGWMEEDNPDYVLLLVGGNDLLIAAQALTLGYTIVTDNDREFSRINQLRLENWLRPS